jgi:hypothetical protein
VENRKEKIRIFVEINCKHSTDNGWHFTNDYDKQNMFVKSRTGFWEHYVSIQHWVLRVLTSLKRCQMQDLHCTVMNNMFLRHYRIYICNFTGLYFVL